MPMISSYTVSGMTCDHCVRAVSEEVAAVEGVHDVQVDLTSGALTVTSTEPVDLAVIESAVDEAGDYTVAAS